MSSHWDWAEKVIAEHERTKPFSPENGSALKFKAGDRVVYTNPQGVTFRLTVTGHYLPEIPCSLYARGARYLLNWGCPWFPVPESCLRLAQPGDAAYSPVD